MDVEFSLSVESVDQADCTVPPCVEPQLTVREALQQLKRHSRSGILVCREGTLVGIFTERDALRVMARQTDLDVPVETVMTRNPVTVRAETSVALAIRKMVAGGYRRLPVVDATGRPTAVVDVSGIIHFLVEHFPRTIYNLPPLAHPEVQAREGA